MLPSTDTNNSNGNGEQFGFLTPAVPSQLQVDFLELMEALEAEMGRNRRTVKRTGAGEAAILVHVTTGAISEAEDSMAELRELALSAGIAIVDEIIQRRPAIDPRTVMGKGKLDELLIRAMQIGTDAVIFDRELQPAQVRSISDATDLKVVDRSQLILDIFAQRAQSREGKIQVELAQLKYILPRLVIGQNSAFSRLAGGIGGRGPGETKLETDRRRVRDRIHRLEKELTAQRGHREQRRKERLRHQVQIISIVGYTNAGKSTLLNALTASHVVAEKRMFATLDPTSRRLRLPREREVIINDTVGFIRDLPPDLLAAFRATLEEIEGSRLLIHLVDASNPRWEQQIASVNRILSELSFDRIPVLLVFNKADLVDSSTLAAMKREAALRYQTQPLSISSVDSRGLDPLLDQLERALGT
jgi:GTP-binding protein HflX